MQLRRGPRPLHPARVKKSTFVPIGRGRPHGKRGGRDPVGLQHRIGAVEQVAKSAPIVRMPLAPAPMLRTVMDYVAALAQRRQLVECAVIGHG